jgi:8-oxo-dGTP pyrophosphatase MutT (NUDIX family)
MNFDPQKFFIGMMDFFTILLPGALLTYLLKGSLGPLFLDKYPIGDETEKWIVFFFCSYLLGHLIFPIGAWLLDDHLYDSIRSATYNGRIERLTKGEKLPWRLTRLLARCLIKKKADLALREAERIMEYHLDPLGASTAINAFQWCKAGLTLKHTEAMVTVQRFEADSKFFRSLFVVLCFFIPLSMVKDWSVVKYQILSVINDWGVVKHQVCSVVDNRTGLMVTLVGLLMLFLAFWRYVDQRIKAMNQAFWYIITLEGESEGGFRQPLSPQPHGATHAGGVVFRRRCGRIEYLLVQDKKKPYDWVLPKGHIEPGERIKDTAVREVHEETGVWARIRDDLDRVSFTANGEDVRLQAYLMEAEEVGKSGEERKTQWLPSREAVDETKKHKEIRKLLEQADKKREELLKNDKRS